MGYRTVVILSNDHISIWENDALLGTKIARAMNYAMGSQSDDAKYKSDLGYGSVVQCAHADQQTLAVIEGNRMRSLAHTHWHSNCTDESTALDVLRQAAEKLGYALRKKTTKA